MFLYLHDKVRSVGTVQSKNNVGQRDFAKSINGHYCHTDLHKYFLTLVLNVRWKEYSD